MGSRAHPKLMMTLHSHFPRLKIALVSVLLVLSAGLSHAGTIRFEGVAPFGGSVIGVSPYTEAGFILTDVTPGGLEGIFDSAFPVTNANGTAVFGFCSFCGPGGSSTEIRLDRPGSVFSLVSLDAAALEAFSGAAQSILATGNINGGGTVAQTLDLTDTWTTFAFQGFTNLTSVVFTAALPIVPDPAMDNIVVNVTSPDGNGNGGGGAAVPEPSSFLLLGPAVLAAAWLRRQK
jgi:hypothetical protein